MAKLKCIMLVDDDEVTNFINSEIIEEMNITEKIEVCTNGQEALDFFEKTNPTPDVCDLPELIFLDINMPVMNGFEFLKAFKSKYGQCRNSVIITMLTTSLRSEDMQQARDFEDVVNGYIEKPLTTTVVQNVIQQHVKK